MTLPVTPAQLVGCEHLHVGGGYGSAAAGTSPAGGLSVDHAGHAALSGDLTIDGALSAAGLVKHWQRYIGAINGAPDASNPPAGPTLTGWGTRISTYTLNFGPTSLADAHFNVAMPPTYDGRPLIFELLWGAQAGTSGAVRWELRGYCLAHGANLAETAVPSNIVNDTFDGVNLMHVTPISHQPLNSASHGLMTFVVRRRAVDVEDTFNDTAKLIGVRIAYT